MDSRSATLRVNGMTCGHCVAAVSAAASSIPNVDRVEVDLDSGTVKVAGEDIDPSAVQAAIAEAGYETVP